MKTLLTILLAAALAAPAAASAETVVADPDARQVSALAGTLVWVSGEGPGQKLMRRTPDGEVAPVAGSAGVGFFRGPDLGRDADGRLVLTYARCSTITRCRYVRDDLQGDRVRLKGLARENCAVSSTPAIWGARIAYGLSCFKRSGGQRVSDPARSGLYVKRGARKPRRLSTPRKVRRAGSDLVSDVDLRGTRVAAIYEDVSEFAVIQTVRERNRAVILAAASEGESDQSVAGLTAGTGDVRMWFLTRASHAGDPAQSIIHRVKHGCDDWQVLTGSDPNAEFDYPYVDLTVDAGTLYAVDPGTGIVTHTYEPSVGC